MGAPFGNKNAAGPHKMGRPARAKQVKKLLRDANKNPAVVRNKQVNSLLRSANKKANIKIGGIGGFKKALASVGLRMATRKELVHMHKLDKVFAKKNRASTLAALRQHRKRKRK